MSFQKIRKMLVGWLSSCLTATTALLPGCTGSDVTCPQSGASGRGTAAVEVRVGKVGQLAKRTVIELEYIVMKISLASNDSVIVVDTSDLSGHGETVVSRRFTDLSAPELYKLEAKTVDDNGTAIHSGSAVFTTVPADTVGVSLNLHAKYSMLRVSFNSIPDSVDAVMLGIAGVDTLESSFTLRASDTVVLRYDYLAADTTGKDYSIYLTASGSYYGNDTVLYTADTTVTAISGADTNYTVVMKWVGPGIPDGATAITVTIGTVGTATINTGFTEMGGLSDLVDDLEDGDGLTRYQTNWFSYCDQDFGGNSTVSPPRSVDGNPFTPFVAGAMNSSYAASFSYLLDQADYEHEPYAGMGFDLDTVSGMDISSAKGIRFYFKGNSVQVLIHCANVTDFGFWEYTISASADWKLIDLTWAQFNQPSWAIKVPFDRTVVKHIQFQVLGQTGDTGTVWVDDIHLPGFLR